MGSDLIRMEAILDNEGQPIYLFTLPPSCITGVIFGTRVSQENKSKIVDVLSTGVVPTETARCITNLS